MGATSVFGGAASGALAGSAAGTAAGVSAAGAAAGLNASFTKASRPLAALWSPDSFGIGGLATKLCGGVAPAPGLTVEAAGAFGAFVAPGGGGGAMVGMALFCLLVSRQPGVRVGFLDWDALLDRR